MRTTNAVTTRKRRKKIIKQAKGSWGSRHKEFRVAKQTVIRAGEYAYRDRKNKKRTFRKLWIVRLNSALREMGYSYSNFIGQAKKKNMEINRKMLSELAINNKDEFAKIVNSIMKK